MHRKYTQLALALGSVFGALTLVVVPVGAEHASPVAAQAVNTATTSPSNTDSGSGASGQGSLRAQAQQLLAQERAKVKTTTEAERQKACVAHQQEINTRVNDYAAAAQRHLDVFNGIFTKVQTFYTNKKLNVTDYSSLVATATAKQTTAQSAVDTLKSLDVSIDCTQPDPATAVATVKTAVANARTALQDYRTAIKNVIVALEGASTGANSNAGTAAATPTTTTTGGNQ